eukprot:CAMPEP_0174910352 /NCGR_PEP_ID=MMETSP0167-20121228/72203_1 /TAXON_ID=38298 /ORGANISM="Rhodella maculata, Strain CCMP736" /LENGTH=56 /DNA_ID=CAMNT_0016154587 /DNA_START=231 /DNA_END=401 /DNA_ORIENTATION=-
MESSSDQALECPSCYDDADGFGHHNVKCTEGQGIFLHQKIRTGLGAQLATVGTPQK